MPSVGRIQHTAPLGPAGFFAPIPNRARRYFVLLLRLLAPSWTAASLRKGASDRFASLGVAVASFLPQRRRCSGSGNEHGPDGVLMATSTWRWRQHLRQSAVLESL